MYHHVLFGPSLVSVPNSLLFPFISRQYPKRCHYFPINPRTPQLHPLWCGKNVTTTSLRGLLLTVLLSLLHWERPRCKNPSVVLHPPTGTPLNRRYPRRDHPPPSRLIPSTLSPSYTCNRKKKEPLYLLKSRQSLLLPHSPDRPTLLSPPSYCMRHPFILTHTYLTGWTPIVRTQRHFCRAKQ